MRPGNPGIIEAGNRLARALNPPPPSVWVLKRTWMQEQIAILEKGLQRG